MVYHLYIYRFKYISVPVTQFQYVSYINTVTVPCRYGITMSNNSVWFYDMITIPIIQFYYYVIMVSQHHMACGSMTRHYTSMIYYYILFISSLCMHISVII